MPAILARSAAGGHSAPGTAAAYEQATGGAGPTSEAATEFVKGLFIPVLELTVRPPTLPPPGTVGRALQR